MLFFLISSPKGYVIDLEAALVIRNRRGEVFSVGAENRVFEEQTVRNVHASSISSSRGDM